MLLFIVPALCAQVKAILFLNFARFDFFFHTSGTNTTSQKTEDENKNKWLTEKQCHWPVDR